MEPETKGTRIIIRVKEVLRRTGKSRSQLYRDMHAGKFPAGVDLGENQIGWYDDEVDCWVDNRPRRGPGLVEAAAAP